MLVLTMSLGVESPAVVRGYDLALWILWDNTWNDSGSWVDSETWND